MTHELKVLPDFFADIYMQRKQFEVRKNDRDFKAGDILILRLWSPETGYGGAELTRTITYILPGGQFGIETGYCVLSI